MSALRDHRCVGPGAVVTVDLCKMLPSENGHGRTRRRVGTRTGTVDLWVDWGGVLRALGPKALASKRGVTVLAGGLIQVRVRRGTVRDESRAEGRAS